MKGCVLHCFPGLDTGMGKIRDCFCNGIIHTDTREFSCPTDRVRAHILTEPKFNL